MGYIYIIKHKNANLYKIGCTKDINKRTRHLNNIAGGIVIKYIIEIESYKEEEKRLHRIFSNNRKDGEWFNLNEKCFEIILNDYKDYIIFK